MIKTELNPKYLGTLILFVISILLFTIGDSVIDRAVAYLILIFSYIGLVYTKTSIPLEECKGSKHIKPLKILNKFKYKYKRDDYSVDRHMTVLQCPECGDIEYRMNNK